MRKERRQESGIHRLGDTEHKMKKETWKYEDIISREWKRESISKRMPLSQRAKIFLPFAAFTGYEEELEKTLKSEIENMSRRTSSG